MNADVLKTYKEVDTDRVDKLLKCEVEKSRRKIVVLDDDPTGVQTVHDISVYTDWDEESVLKGFEEKNNLFYILTNSRGLTSEETKKVHIQIAEAVSKAAKKTNRDYIIISRSDSTLRGHYPLETEILKECYEKNTGKKLDGEILCPFFKEGGRYTIDNIHYVKYGRELIPACKTEFAKDKTFGYTAVSMPDYVEEKTGGKYKAEDVICISLNELRNIEIDGIQRKLEQVEDFNKIIVNAIDYVDLKVFCTALYRAMENGKNYMFRTAAAFVKVMGDIPDRELLTRKDMVTGDVKNGGIVVVGSHTDKTTSQIEELKKLDNVDFIEMDVSAVWSDAALAKEVERCIEAEEKSIRAGRTACCYTSRTQIIAGTGEKEDELKLSVKISNAVQELVGKLEVVPGFIIAKGGITSSDVGTKALAVKKANVLGQIKPGIPVWQTGKDSKFPMIPYVIFPGNVGESETLRETVEVLTATYENRSREGGIGE